MKKIFSCILAIIILGAMLSGCSNNDSKEMIKKAKNFSIPHEVSINPTKEDYGILAYNFLHYILATHIFFAHSSWLRPSISI